MDTPQVINVSCGECQWLKSLDSRPDAGECRADPPRVIAMPGKVIDQYGRTDKTELNVCFPTVPKGLWCGRFVPRKVQLD